MMASEYPDAPYTHTKWPFCRLLSGRVDKLNSIFRDRVALSHDMIILRNINEAFLPSYVLVTEFVSGWDGSGREDGKEESPARDTLFHLFAIES